MHNLIISWKIEKLLIYISTFFNLYKLSSKQTNKIGMFKFISDNFLCHHVTGLNLNLKYLFKKSKY